MLFEMLYSYTIAEDVKSSIVERVKDRIGDELNEDLNNGSHYVAFINTLLESDISDMALDETLDLAFSGLSEEAIDEITEEFKKAAVIRAINEWDPAPVGLTGVRRAAEKASEPKAPSAMDRLKSAVGKVKGWAKTGAEKVKAGFEKAKSAINQPTGLDKLKQMRADMVKHAVEMGTSPKVEQPKAEAKPEAPRQEAPKAQAKAKTTSKPKATAPKASKVEQPKAEALKQEAPKAKTTRKAKTTSLKNAAKEVIANAEQAKEKVPVKRGRKKALQEAIELISSTSISESSLVEIIEMISNKKAAKKAVEREYGRFKQAADQLNRVEEVKAKTGVSPVSLEQHDQMIKKAEEAGNKYEQVKASSERKFGK